MKYLLIIFAIFSFLFSESVFASSRLISDLGVTASRQVVRSFSVLFQPAVAWDVVPKVDDRGIIRPVIDWATGKQEIPISFDGNVDFIERFYNGCVPNMSPGTNHRVDFVSPLKLELFSSPDSSDKYRQSVRNAIAKQVRNYEPEGIRFVDTILANDLVLFTAYPSCEIRNGGIKDCRWFVDLAEITKYKTFDEYLEGLALLKRWIPLSEAYDSLALMHLKKGSRFSGLIGKAALQTHPGFRDLNPLLSLPYSEQLVACQEMVGRLKHYSSFHISDSIAPATFHSRRFVSSSQTPSLLESPDVKAALRKINGNCLKEIGATGSDDFVGKSHRVVSLLKMSFTRGSSIDGQGGLADAESDWLAAWERQPEAVQVRLQNPHNAIQDLINIANEHFYGIEPE